MRMCGKAMLFLLVIAFFDGSVSTALDRIPSQPVDGTITWIYDYDEGKRLAQQSGKPIFLVFRCER